MEKQELAEIRNHLGKTQKQFAQLIGISLKSIKSFEQGWRNIPTYIERQVLFILVANQALNKNTKPCWVIKKCPMAIRQNCPAWELKAGQVCWFINGTICKGKVQKDWSEKMKICRKCKVFKLMIPLKESRKQENGG
ncbi:MAG: helix-turn-helix transcriptional regulator [Desulfobulbaceae bacterium]|nr:helix-turn-helix transcriptional regulator [Desulfobulbaceae bacterium]